MAAASTRWVNPRVLKEARERAGLTPEEVGADAKELGKRHYAPVRAEELRRWEDGHGEPDLEHLETLSEIYLCPVGHFFLNKMPEEPLALTFRGLTAEKELNLSPLTRRTLRRFCEFAQWTVEFIENVGEPWEPRIWPGRYRADTRQLPRVVRAERRRFGWDERQRAALAGDPRKAFRWWRKAIEDEGVFCFEMKLEPSEVRGASMWLEKRYPFILINRQDAEAATGRIFTLLHEYAHLVTAGEGLVCDFRGPSKGENPEPFANRFAARILVTYQELASRLNQLGYNRRRENWPDRVLDEIRAPFLVSRDVVAIMLQEMHLAPANFYAKNRQKWENRKPWGRGGKRPTNRELKLRELGYSLTRLLSKHRDHARFPWLDVSYTLDMKLERVPDFLQWASGVTI